MRWTLPTLLLVACAQAPPAADPEFSDATRFLFRSFEGPEEDLAFALRALEVRIDAEMELASNDVKDRALTPEFLDPTDVEGLNADGGDVDRALPVAVARLSAFPVAAHTQIQLLEDHTPVEPSAEVYDRVFTDGLDCWEDARCDMLRTDNTLTKSNVLMTVDYTFRKDLRWVDLGLPDPSSLTPDEPAVNPGERRPAILARSWTEQAWTGRTGSSSIDQSYTIEVWLPRGDQTVRMLTLWAEGTVGFTVSDDLIVATSRAGMDDTFEAADAWLAQRP